jgi:WD40 repeat protein
LLLSTVARAEVTHLSLNADGSLVAGIVNEKTVYKVLVWDGKSGKLLSTVTAEEPLTEVAVSPTERLIAYATQKPGDAVRLITPEGKAVRSLAEAGACIGFSRDGKLIATNNDDLKLRLWNVATGAKLEERVGFRAPGGTRIVVLHDKTLCFTSGTVQCSRPGVQFPQKMAGTARRIDVSPDGKTLLAYDGGMVLWDAATGTLIKQSERLDCDGCGDRVNDHLFTADGKFIVLPYEKALQWLSLPDLKKGPLRNAGFARIGSLALSSDGKRMAIADRDVVHVYEGQTDGAKVIVELHQ